MRHLDRFPVGIDFFGDFSLGALQVLPLTDIALPVDQYDPKGKFSNYNFPNNLTKQGAIDMIADPAGPMAPQ